MILLAPLLILPFLSFCSSFEVLSQFRLSLNPNSDNIVAESSYWYENIVHNGQASFMDPSCKSSYQVFRNAVTDFGADNTGKTDASTAIQNAINAFSSVRSACANRTANAYGTTGQPAIVYLPSGTYLMQSSIQIRIGTVLMGDATNLPTLKAAASFPTGNNQHIIYAKDRSQPGTTNFYISIRNLIIDSTALDPAASIGHIDWTVSQGTSLTNVVFEMPNNSKGHVGVTSNQGYNDSDGYNSALILNDLTFNGGASGMILNGQQWVLKGMSFNQCTNCLVAAGFNLVVHNSSFTDCAVGIDAHGISGSLTVLDTVADSIGTLVASSDSMDASNSIVLENVKLVNSGHTVQLDNSPNPPLTGNVPNTWVHGDLYASEDFNKQFQEGEFLNSNRVSALTANGNDYFATKPPTYKEFSINQVVNIKDVPGVTVHGDGTTDDTASINTVLAQSTGKVVYFPAGTYMVSGSIVIRPGSRIIGDPYASVISAMTVPAFFNPNSPTAMVQLGLPGDIGIGQISDMIFTVGDVLQGCKLLEVNMAGDQPGDVGVWNSHFRVGGAAGSKVKTVCSTTPQQCKAAWGLLHLTNSSSAYIENMWGWTADHDLDLGPNTVSGAPVIATGRGALIEATKGTWLVGTAMEHNTLYQYNFNNAANVASIFQQSETPYWQGPSTYVTAPAPWTDNLVPSDPTFKNCGVEDALCRMAWFELVNGSNNIFLYGGCVWAFFNSGADVPVNNATGSNCGQFPNCQRNAIEISNSSRTFVYGTNVRAIKTVFVNDGQDVALMSDNPGSFWPGGVIAAYLFDSA